MPVSYKLCECLGSKGTYGVGGIGVLGVADDVALACEAVTVLQDGARRGAGIPRAATAQRDGLKERVLCWSRG